MRDVGLRLIEERSSLDEYASIPIAFEVTERCDLASATIPIQSIPLARAYVKDYDHIDGQHPTQWSTRFNLEHWRFIGAYVDGERIGGAAVILDAASNEVATLYDLRVHPTRRRRGVGRQLLECVEQDGERH